MSETFTLKSRSSTFSIDFPTPIVLDPNYEYGLALIGFYSYNTIPNIEEGTKFKYYSKGNDTPHFITIPTGTYEITDLEAYLKNQLSSDIKEDFGDELFFLRPNNNTLKCELFFRDYDIDFRRGYTKLANLLGFSPGLLAAGKVHASDLPVNIIKVRTIHIDCNIIGGSYYYDKPSHTLYEFPITSDPGYAIDEVPRNLIYLPVIRREINNITLEALDQNFEPINFRGEETLIRLELKKLWSL